MRIISSGRTLNRAKRSPCESGLWVTRGPEMLVRPPSIKPCGIMSRSKSIGWICMCMSAIWRIHRARMTNSKEHFLTSINPLCATRSAGLRWAITKERRQRDCWELGRITMPTFAQNGAKQAVCPSASEAFYAFDYANVHFICLDSHDLDRAPTGVMAQWLRADLEKTKSDWIIAYWHHPPYTKGSHDSDKEQQLVEMRELIMPILEAGGVDLVLTGHSHIYERSMLIDGAYQTPTTADGVVLDDGDGNPNGDGPYRKSKGLHAHQGTVQVVTGNGGAKVSRLGTSPVMKQVIVEYGSTILDVDGDTLTGVMVNRSGESSDLFSIVKQGSVVPKIVTSPRTLPPYTVAFDKPKVEKSELTPFPKNAVNLIKPNSAWDYLAGSHPPEKWTAIAFIPNDAGGWKSGTVGIGYGDSDDVTELKDMEKKYTVVYARSEFELPPGEKEKIGELGLAISYDDAFIAYLNGHEVLRVGVKEGHGVTANQVESHEAEGYEYFPLKDAKQYLTDDDNILSIEGHNTDVGSSDFTLDPYLLAVPRATTP